jgi:hypothetical protein
MSITAIARQAQGIRAGEVIARLTEERTYLVETNLSVQTMETSI